MELKERRFFDALRKIFVGAKIEGESGFVNLMRVKSRYYENVAKYLQNDIEKALSEFPEFREELFDRLYTFFRRYFSESGSIYFLFTPPHEHVYEKVYSDDQNVVLFWKTHMLYYVKADRLFQSMLIELDGFRFFFDVSNLEHKRSNEKRSLIYSFKKQETDRTLVFSVAYSEKGRQTQLADIRRTIKEVLGLPRYTQQVPTEETLEQAFRLFERQSEVDYFINKDARRFLQEQFSMWLYQYVFEPVEQQGTTWTDKRIRQLQTLKEIAYKIIDFIAQFEDELVRIWNKPKFVLGSHYVITLNRIAAQEGGMAVLERLFAHHGMAAQVQEWRNLGMVGEDFTPDQVWVEDLTGKRLHDRYQYLPLDTQYFTDLEIAILSLFDNLDRVLDGWLVNSENYQALNTMLSKFQERVQTIYIDPPFNKDQEADYFYSVKYKDATWITMLENRIERAKTLLNEKGSIFVRCDYNGNMYVRLLLNEIFGSENFRNEIVVKRGSPKAGLFLQFDNLKSIGVSYDNLYWFSKNHERVLGKFTHRLQQKTTGYWTSFKKIYDRPTMRYEILGLKLTEGQWMWKKERAYEAVENYLEYLRVSKESGETLEEYWNRTGKKLEFVRRHGNSIQYWVPPKEETLLDNNWLDISGYSSAWDFKTENSEVLLKRVIDSNSIEGDLVMDFFLGSGTTIAVAQKLGRRWIGIEMGEHFWTVVLPRLKKVLRYDPSGISKEVNKYKGGGFFKYYRLEQYEDVLRKARYRDDDAPLFFQDPYTQYIFLRDTKMLDNAETGEPVMKVDLERNEIRVDLSRLYPDIDLAETLSCLTGKWIRRIHPVEDDPTRPGTVEFEDGTTVDLQNPPWEWVKPLIWW